MANSDASATAIVREGLERACRGFSEGIALRGFVRTRKMLWTRERSHTVDFVHFHRDGSSYGAASNYSCSIRVHFGIRVLNDGAESLALNGPSSSECMGPKARY